MSASLDFEAARTAMVNSQLRPNKLVDDRLTDALRTVPRERFVPKDLQGIAYIDEDLPFGGGRYLMEPMVLTRLLQSAEIEADDMVLDVGCLTGYAAAVMAALANTVVAVDSDPAYVAGATETLAALDITNVAVVEAPLAEGLPDQGPYDVVLVEGAVAEVPQALLDQVAEGGRLLTVLRRDGMGVAHLFTRQGNIGKRPLFDAATPVLPGFEMKQGFVF
ncbi:MAG: protein-L-isoaspartate O-methyltransferase family protein [Minwuia sp.]|uniref:protein-L-isoaspartate O-methyltransferase family protein n=1 Tax=Minwuia sp. TaxID=2493630 RepID=UPI003A894453